MAHMKDCKPCAYCRHRDETLARRRAIRLQQRKDYLQAKKDGIESGKVVVLTLRDELTGFFYRYNKAGNPVLLGYGDNHGA